MYSDVEGEWKNFQFHMIKPEHYPQVLEHLQENFYNSTPLTRCLERTKEFHNDFDKVYLTILPHNLSFMAVNKETNKIAGLRITYIQTRDLEVQLSNLGFKTRQIEIMNLIMGTVNKLSHVYDTFGIDSYVNFYTACVDPIYGGQGLATEMYRRALNFIRGHPDNFYLVKSNLTSPYTRSICHKFGFKELARVYYNDFRDDRGIPLLKGATDDEFVAFMSLQLR